MKFLSFCRLVPFGTSSKIPSFFFPLTLSLPTTFFSLEQRNFCPKISQFLSFHRIFFPFSKEFYFSAISVAADLEWLVGMPVWEGIDIDDKEKIKLPENISRRPLCLLGCERWRNFVWMKKADDIQNGYYLV